MRIMQEMSLMEKLNILSDAAKYDVACTSSGSNRRGDGKGIGNTVNAGICHSFSADGRCISLLKILFTNECIYDCKYCQNRRSNDVPRASFTPDEVCRLTIEFYRRNYIEGLFLSSGIIQNPNVTMGLLYQTIYKLRTQYHFQGYIHVKAIPGADPELIRLTGFLADRMSINLELPTAEGLSRLAPNKIRSNQSFLPIYRHDYDRCVCCTSRIGRRFGKRFNLFRIRHHIKFPRLLVARAGCLHTRPQNLHQLFFFHLFVFIPANTDSVKNTVHRSSFSCCYMFVYL